jgi:hypothetical protein
MMTLSLAGVGHSIGDLAEHRNVRYQDIARRYPRALRGRSVASPLQLVTQGRRLCLAFHAFVYDRQFLDAKLVAI